MDEFVVKCSATTIRWTSMPVLLAVLLAIGCKGNPPKPVPVKGKVLDEGRNPLPEVVLTFHSVDESNKNARMETAITNKEGEFSLHCAKGRYKVTMVALPKGGSNSGGPVALVPGPNFGPAQGELANYRNPQKTPWDINVPENGDDALLLVVK
jgi:hypothetical protein